MVTIDRLSELPVPSQLSYGYVETDDDTDYDEIEIRPPFQSDRLFYTIHHIGMVCDGQACDFPACSQSGWKAHSVCADRTFSSLGWQYIARY